MRYAIVPKSFFSILFLVLFYKVLLDIGYIYISAKDYLYMGTYKNLNVEKLIFAYTSIIVLTILLTYNHSHISDFFKQLLFIIVFVPYSTVFSLKNQSTLYFLTAFLCFILIILSSKLFHKIRIRNLKEGKNFWFIFILLFSAISYLILISNLGLKFNLSFENVYDIRFSYKEELKYSGEMIDYIINWQGNVINPFLFGFFIVKKKYRYAWIILGLQLLLFSYTGYKSVFFAVFAIYVVLMLQRRNSFLNFTLIFSILTMLAISIYFIFRNQWIFFLFAQRLLILPAQISFQYFEFFSMHDLVKLSHSIFSSFFEYPYKVAPAFLIGELYYNNSAANANTSFLADAYMNFGIAGMLIYSIFLSFIFYFIDCISLKKNKTLITVLLFVPIFSLSNAGLLTTINTHGLGLAILIAYLMPVELDKESR